MRAFALLLLLVLPLALVPGAAADHVYSHRYVVLGRVVDSEGLPVENASVSVQVRGVQPGGLCAPMPGGDTDAFPGTTRNVTDGHGEFWFCLHLHALPANAGFRVLAGGASADVDADLDLRQSFVVVRLAAPSPQANETAAEGSHTVLGRAWTPGEQTLEGVPVRGSVAARVPVRVTLRPEGGEPVILDTATNAYGDFAVRVPTEGRLTTGRVLVEAANETFEADLGDAGATHLRVILEAPPATGAPPSTSPPATRPPGGATPIAQTPAATSGTGAALQEGGADAPANETPFPALLAVAGLALAGLARRGGKRT